MDSTIDLALVSPRISPWLSAETLTPHSSDHLPVVFSLQKPAKKQNVKPNNPFRYEKSGSDVVSKLRKRKPRTQNTKGSRKSKKQPSWWDSETEKAWTEKCAAVNNWQKGRTRPNPDPTLKTTMDDKTEQFKKAAREAKEAKWKTFCENLSADTTLSQFWQFYQQMEGSDRTQTTPDLEDMNGARLKTNEEKGQALLGRFIQQSNQNNLDERKHILSDLNSTLSENGPDDEITEEEFNEALKEVEKIQHLVRIWFDTRILSKN